MCEPEAYGADFLYAIDSASIEKRKLFCNYWKHIGVEKFSIKNEDEERYFSCMIGIVDHNFDKGKVDCLLHRDFF